MLKSGRLALAAVSMLAILLLAACMSDSRSTDPGDERPGIVRLSLVLMPSSNALLKIASADTIFRLDTLVIELSAVGVSTIVNKYPISGRADSSSIAVSEKTYSLAPLRTWTAKIYSIDTTLNPARADTVHRDSVTFNLKAGDDLAVTKTVNPVFTILRARFVSNAPGSVTNPVKFVRIRVDGTMRDSIPVGPALHAASFLTTSGIAVGDSGTILRTTNTALNWTLMTVPTTANLLGAAAPTNSAHWAVGVGGVVVKTTNGTTWTLAVSGTTNTLNAASFSGANAGCAVGNSGTIIRTSNGTLFSTIASGTTQNLYGIHLFTANNGNAVGANGVILRTTDGGATWAPQTSGTTAILNGVCLPAAATIIAVGNGGLIRRSTNTGSTWATVTSGTTENLNAIFFTTANNGIIAGDAGTILTTTDGGASWTARSSGTTNNFDGVAWTSNDNAGVAVGAYSTIDYTTNYTSYVLHTFGTKSFDLSLTYKYLSPNVSHTLLMQAIDTLQGTLRGYQVSKTLLLSPGKDTTVTPNAGLTQCGASPVCTP